MNTIQLYDQYVTAPRSGGQLGTTHEVTTVTLKLRADQRIDLPGPWKLALREDLPFDAKNPVSAANPSGEYVNGIGDVHAQAVLIREIDARWTIGFGTRLYAPTGDSSLGLGSGKWQIMPVVGVRYAMPEISDGSYFEPQLWYDQSFAGDPSKKNISNLRFAPVWRIALPDRWFVTFYPSPDIRVNYGDPIFGQTGRLFLPFDFQLGRKLADNLTVSLELSVPIIKDYPVYDFKTAARLNLTF
ncbi:MAG: transporter [Xanthobacteraceae bacterium]|nr:transporter [Xanthobacteraceae bacterium]